MASPDGFEFFCRVKINSGNKALEHLPYELEALDAGKPLVITDKKNRAGILAGALKDSGMTYGVFDRLPGDPGLDTVAELASIYREKDCDALVAVGSGPVMDTAKAVNILATHRADRLDRFAGANAVTGPLKPLIAIPTATCKGREVSKFAAVGGLTFVSQFLMPDLVIVDPRMVTPKDARITVSAAMSALTCSAESYVDAVRNPVADVYASAAIKLVSENLLEVVNNAKARKGRMALVNAAVMAGCAFSNVSHGIAYRLGKAAGELCDVPRGLCRGIILPYALEYHTLKNDVRTSDLLLPLAGPDVYAGTSENLRAPIAVNMIYAMQYDLNKATRGEIPLTLKDAGVERGMLEAIAEKVSEKDNGAADLNICRTVLHHAWEGRPIVSL
jgi:alcohol dehydrogenase